MSNHDAEVKSETPGDDVPRGRGVIYRLLRFVRMCFGFSLLVVASYWTGLGDAGMATVSLVRPG
jgi:hypothetical protein